MYMWRPEVNIRSFSTVFTFYFVIIKLIYWFVGVCGHTCAKMWTRMSEGSLQEFLLPQCVSQGLNSGLGLVECLIV